MSSPAHDPMATALVEGPADADWTVILAHGAGAPMDSPFMEVVARGLVGLGHRVVRFEFPYMAVRRETGKKRPPNPQRVLLATWREVHASFPGARLAIGGKSMGGRMASLLADELGVGALVCLGYPFHPAGKPEKTRTEHLAELRTPTLIVQGERDALGRRDEVEGYDLSEAIELCWLEDGNHSLVPRKRSGLTEAEHLAAAVAAIDGFLRRAGEGII